MTAIVTNLLLDYAPYIVAGIVLALTFVSFLRRSIILMAISVFLGLFGAGAAFLFHQSVERAGSRIAEGEAKLRDTENSLYAKSTALDESIERVALAWIPAFTRDQGLQNMFAAMRHYDQKSFDEMSTSILSHVGNGFAYHNALFMEEEAYRKIIANAFQDADDEIILGMTIYYADFFKSLKEAAPSTCSVHIKGGLVWPTGERAFYQYTQMYKLLFEATNARAPAIDKTTVSRREALNFSYELLGEERHKGIINGTATTADVCDSLSELYTAIGQEEFPRSAGLMRLWANPHLFRSIE